MRAIILAVALAVTLATLSRGAAAEKYMIASEVWGWYQQYVRDIGNGKKPGAFAISKDGHRAYYTWCQDIRCAGGTTYSQHALNNCEREYDTECVVFAVRNDIKVEYEVLGYSPSSNASRDDPPDATSESADTASEAPSTDAPPSPAAEPTIASVPNPPEIKAADPPKVEVPVAPATRILVTAEVQEKIDVYLRNAQSTARVWAFAVTKNGTDGAMASCAAGSTYAGGRSCYPVMGTKEELVKREALARCGGPSDCILLYLGQQKQGNFEIVVQ